MDIHSISIDLQTGKYHVEFAGSDALLETIYGTKVPIYLPDYEASHELAGQWFLNNVQLRPCILSKAITFNLKEYGQQENGEYKWFPPVFFVKSEEWELIADHNVFDHEIIFYFRPRPTWRKNPYASPINLSQR